MYFPDTSLASKKSTKPLLKIQDKISRAPWIYIKGDRGKTPFRKANFYLRRRCADPHPRSARIGQHTYPFRNPPPGVWQNLKDGLNPCLWYRPWLGRKLIIWIMVGLIEYITRVKAESPFKLFCGVFPSFIHRNTLMGVSTLEKSYSKWENVGSPNYFIFKT